MHTSIRIYWIWQTNQGQFCLVDIWSSYKYNFLLLDIQKTNVGTKNLEKKWILLRYSFPPLHFCNFTPKKFLFYFLTHFRNLWLIMNREELLHGSLGGGKMYIEQWDKGGKGWIWLLTKGILGHNTQMGAQMNGQVGGREMEKGIPWRQRQGMRDVDRNDGRPAIHLHHMLCYSQHSKRWAYLRGK